MNPVTMMDPDGDFGRLINYAVFTSGSKIATVGEFVKESRGKKKTARRQLTTEVSFYYGKQRFQHCVVRDVDRGYYNRTRELFLKQQWHETTM